MDKLERLIAKSEIEEAMCRYARGVDRADWDAVRACYHDDAVDEHGAFRGTADEFIDWVKDRLGPVPFAMHFLGNCLIDFLDDRTAAVETYFVAHHLYENHHAGGDDGTAMEDVYGRYVDRFERREDGVWRIAARRVVYDCTRTQPSTHHIRKLVGSIGRRDHLDPVYENLRGGRQA